MLKFYKNPDRYDLEYDVRLEDKKFYLKLCSSGMDVLELGSGSGRITYPLFKKKVNIVGIEKSPEMIAAALKKQKNLKVINKSFLNFNLNKTFDQVIMPFNTLQHVYTNKDLIKLLENIKRHLKKGGRFIFDVVNPDINDLARKTDEVWIYDSFFVVSDKLGIRRAKKLDKDKKIMLIEDSVKYNNKNQIAHYTLNYYLAKKQIYNVKLKQRMFFPLELDFILEASGFKILEKLGDFDGSSFTNNSASQIIISKV
jgi:SAM-dependent methyltransferase